MPKNNDTAKEPASIIAEIEKELEDVINRKKDEIEQDLQRKIQLEKDRAKNKIGQIEHELEAKKEELINYRTELAGFENNTQNIRNQKKGHLDKAVQYLRQIETLTAQSLEELQKLTELDHKLDEIAHTVKEKAKIFKKELEKKFKDVAEEMKDEEAEPEETKAEEIEEEEIEAEEAETEENEEFDLELEREKLRKIMELLGTENKPRRRRARKKGKTESDNEVGKSGSGEEDETHPEKSEDE